MKKSRIKHIFSTFNKKEIRDLRKWLLSPAHNQREDVVLLFEYLVENNRIVTEIELDKAIIFPHVFPEETTYDDAKLRQTMYFLLKATERFLIYEEQSKNSIANQITLAKVYRDKRLLKLANKTVEKATVEHEKQTLRNNDYYKRDFNLWYEKFNLTSMQGRAIPFNLQRISDGLDVAYLVDKLRQCCILISHQAVFKTEYKIGLLDEILAYVEANDLLQNPAIAIYYYGFKAITNREEDAYFIALKKNILEHETAFLREELAEVYLMAINYCIRKINAGQRNYYRETFELYRKGIELDLFLDKDKISRFTFTNIISSALILKEFDWVEQFILTYQLHLRARYRESYVHFNLARLEYDRENYDKAMQQLVQADYDDVLMNLNGKTILIKIYYQKEELNALESLLGSMRTYLRRKKMVGYHKTNYQNIIKYVKKLIKVNPFDKSEVEKLSNEITTISPLTEKRWLLQQLEKL